MNNICRTLRNILIVTITALRQAKRTQHYLLYLVATILRIGLGLNLIYPAHQFLKTETLGLMQRYMAPLLHLSLLIILTITLTYTLGLDFNILHTIKP